MAACAGLLIAMLVELLADGGGTANVRFNGGHVLWRRVGRRAENAVEHIRTAHHGRGAGAVGGDFQHRSLRDEATASRTGSEAHFANLLTFHSGDAVVLGEAFVQHREVAVHDVAHAEVAAEQLVEEALGLADHGLLKVLLKLGVELRVGLGEIDVAEIEPASEEVLREVLRFR